LGYHQCKWSYYPESNVKEVAAKFRELKIPVRDLFDMITWKALDALLGTRNISDPNEW
jgi:alpha-glucosidase (family GH31 glycosyl hydrolase)